QHPRSGILGRPDRAPLAPARPRPRRAACPVASTPRRVHAGVSPVCRVHPRNLGHGQGRSARGDGGAGGVSAAAAKPVAAAALDEGEPRPHTHLRLAAVAVLLLAWEAVAGAGVFPKVFLPAPSSVAVELWRMALSGDLWRNLQPSVARILAGFAIG